MGRSHANNLLRGNIKGASLAAVCDLNDSRLAEFSEVPCFKDVGEMFKWDGMDAVIVATPHYAHTTLGVETLKYGKHLLVEKPISVHKEDCEKLYEAYMDSSLVFAAMFNKRTSSLYSKLKTLIDSGELGQLRRINWIITDWFRTASYYRSGGWRATWAGEGGGVLLNQCPHDLDMWQWLFGMPKKLRAYCQFGRYHDIEVEDDVTAYMEYEDGMTGVFIASTGESPGTNRLEIVGERGKVVAETSYGWSTGKDIRFIRNTMDMSEFNRITDSNSGRVDSWDVTIPVGEVSYAHGPVIQNFVDAILHGTPLVAPALEGIHSVELANAMIYSSVHKTDVEFPLDSGKYTELLNQLIAKSTRNRS